MLPRYEQQELCAWIADTFQNHKNKKRSNPQASPATESDNRSTRSSTDRHRASCWRQAPRVS